MTGEQREWRHNPPQWLQEIISRDWTKCGPKAALTELQSLTGCAAAIAANDRDPNRAANTAFVLEIAHKICIQVRGRWKP